MSYLETLPKVQELINSLLIVLSEKEKFIVENRFSLNESPRLTLEKIGAKYNVTRERIRQIEKNALRKLERNVNNTPLRDLTAVALTILEEHGGAMSEDAMVSAVLKNTETPELVDVNSLRLTIDLDKSVIREHNTIRFLPYWRLNTVSSKMVKQICDIAVRELNKTKKITSYARLTTLVTNKFGTLGLSEEFIRSAVGLDRNLKAVNEGVGLAVWRDINPKTLRDKIFYVLTKVRKPLHYVDIANSIIEMGFDRKAVNTQAVHNELIRYSDFILIGRGIYALKEWGYEEGTVADVIERVLRENGDLSRDDIVKKVLERRQVKRITILLNLKNKNQFLKAGKDRYKLNLGT